MKAFYVSLCLFACINVYAQRKPLNYSIANWKNNKKAAVSLTFDDAINGQFTVGLPLLNKYKFKATFFITISNFVEDPGGWDLIKPAARTGHEIANHTINHPIMHTISKDSMAYEFNECNKLIEENFPSAKVETMAYPYGDGGDLTDSEQMVRDVAYRYFIAARSVQYLDIFYNPYDFAKTNDDYYRVNSEMIEDSATAARFPKHLDSAIKLGAWYVPTYHGIENGWMIVTKKDFEKNLQEIARRERLLWIAPFVNVVKYHKEKNCSSVNVLKDDAHASVITITDTLNNKTWNEPLTVNYRTSTAIKNIIQHDKQIRFIQKGRLISFNIIPSSQKIRINKGQIFLRRGVTKPRHLLKSGGAFLSSSCGCCHQQGFHITKSI